jgi:hypothetical protein
MLAMLEIKEVTAMLQRMLQAVPEYMALLPPTLR